MEQESSRRWGAFAAAAAAAVVVVLLILVALARETERIAALPASPVPTSDADPAVAVVNGQPIDLSLWTEAVLVDQVMSGLAGVPASRPELKLEELVNQVLVTQAAPQEAPTREEVEAQIVALEASWGVEDFQVVGSLTAVGLDREALVRSLTRLLVVQRAQETVVEAEGTSIEEWLMRQREQAQVVIHPERMQVDFPSPLPTPSPRPLPTPTRRPELTLAAAPDFSLERAGGGILTLSEQLAEGPVVLVFFQRCG